MLATENVARAEARAWCTVGPTELRGVTFLNNRDATPGADSSAPRQSGVQPGRESVTHRACAAAGGRRRSGSCLANGAVHMAGWRADALDAAQAGEKPLPGIAKPAHARASDAAGTTFTVTSMAGLLLDGTAR